jgi:hypothetical protein
MKPRLACLIAIATLVALACVITNGIHNHLDDEERNAAIPTHPNFGRARK